jgi:hypothetical protein
VAQSAILLKGAWPPKGAQPGARTPPGGVLLRRGRVFRLDWVQWGRQPLWGGSRYMRLRPAPAKVAPRGNDPAPQWSVEGGVSYLHSSRESEWSSASCWASILYLLGEHP